MTGASGVLGRHVATELERRGHTVRYATRFARDGWITMDFRRPETVAKAAAGTDAIVHCAADPFGKARAVEVEGLRRLRDAAPDARIVYPSIVGCDRIRFSYYRVKYDAERKLARMGGDHAIVRLTQFHEFADRLARLPLPMVFAGMRAQTIAASDAARAVSDVVEGHDRGIVGDVGGPEVHRMIDLVKARLRADGRRRFVMRLPVGWSGFRAGYNLCPDDAVGTITWEQHLAAGSDE